MRSILLLSVLLFAAAVLAAKDDVACVVHSDDCGRCVSNGCNWCSDGYCVSKESDICEAHKVATECAAKPIVQADRQRGQRQSSATVCEAISSCAQCAQTTGCSVCRQSPLFLGKCSSTATCIAGPYDTQFEWWIRALDIDPVLNWAVNSCLATRPPAGDSPTLKIKFEIFVVLPGGDFPRDFLRGLILEFMRAYVTGYTADYITIAEPVTVTKDKRQTLDSTASEAVALVKFADFPGASAQAVGATLTAFFDGTTVDPTSAPITATPLRPISASGATGGIISSGNVVNRGGNKGIDISKGALAGIIIGCVIFGALLIALIAWLILRRRDSYPQAFRSPAAAYRP